MVMDDDTMRRVCRDSIRWAGPAAKLAGQVEARGSLVEQEYRRMKVRRAE
jgi:hypothetical protein